MSIGVTGQRAGWAGLMALVLLGSAVLPPGAANAAKPSRATDPPQPTVTNTTTPVLAVSAGEAYTCAIRTNGTLACWGYEDAGEAVPPEGVFTAVSAGFDHTCALDDEGELICWGYQSDDWTTTPDGTFTALSTGATFACGIRVDGSLACWGNNDEFQLKVPTGTFEAVDAGYSHACAIRSDDTLVCWGNNDNGRATPPSGTFVAVSAGESHTCAIQTDGTLACWGYNGDNRSIPPDGTFVSLSAGDAHACAVGSGGELACWGDDEWTQADPPAGTFWAVSAGYDHSCAIRSDDSLVCWGDDWAGQVTPHPIAAIGQLSPWSRTADVKVSWEAVAALAAVTTYDIRYRRATWNGSFGSAVSWLTGTADTSAILAAPAGSTTCLSVRAHDADGAVSGWSEEECAAVPLDDRALTRSGTWSVGTDAAYYGSTYLRSSTPGATLKRTGLASYWVALLATTCPDCGTVQLFLGTSTKPFRTVSLASPTTVTSRLIPVHDADLVDSDLIRGTLTIKVVSTGKPVTIDGLLITPTDLSPVWADASNPPVPAMATSPGPVLAVSAGGDHSCAVKVDGTLACWGNNEYGKAMPPDGTFTAVSAGRYHTCGVRTDGTLACWGYNGWYGLSTPPDGTFTAVSAGRWNTCAIEMDGTVACWGTDYGEDGYLDPPKGVFGSLSAFSLEFGDDYCAVRADGTLACWGPDYDYEVAATPSGTYVATGGSCGIRRDGNLGCWGHNELGQATPPTGSFRAVTTGSLHSCGIRSDDTLFCWGDNEYAEGAAPSGTFTAVDAGQHHTCAVATDGTLACWGHNASGQVTPRPITTMNTLATWLTTRSVALAWRATAIPALTSYDVRYRRAAWNGSFGSAVAWKSGLSGTGATFTGAAGSTYCFSARARDADALVSGWSTETCTSIPLDDRSLTRAGRWAAGTGSAYYGSTYLRSTTAGSTLTRTNVRATRIALVATTCRTCGSVKVFWNGALIKTVSLVSATTVNRKVIVVKAWTSPHTGTLKIKVATGGKTVIIDGVLVRRT